MMKAILMYMIVGAMMIQSPSADKERYRNDFKRIQTAYKSYPNLSFNVSYSDYHNSFIDTSVKAIYCFKGGKFYYKMAQVEVVKNDEYIISINHRKKDIVIYTASDYNADYLPFGMVDSFFNKTNVSVQYKEINHGRTGQYSMDLANSKKPFSKVELEFDKANYLVQNMRLYVTAANVAELYNTPNKTNETARVDYVFSNYRFSNIDEKLFNTGTYIVVSENKFKAVNKYVGYHVVSLIPVHQQSK